LAEYEPVAVWLKLDKDAVTALRNLAAGQCMANWLIPDDAF